MALAVRHYLWAWFPVEQQGDVSKALSALFALFLLGVVWVLADKTAGLFYVMLLGAWEQGATVACSVAHAWYQFPILPGDSICHAWTGFDVGTLGLVFVALVALCLIFIDSKRRYGVENE